jgi:UDP-4-amino-4-deoxy-L-arabinose formyltransferase/UDP-glucuronic acid dehydrogenase (UDP-4-keto-hexauronic acid decarboxylating)
MRTVVLAYHDVGCAGIRSLIDHGYEIAAVFTHAEDPEESGWFDSVAELAARRNIPVFAPEDLNDPIWVARIRDMAP